MVVFVVSCTFTTNSCACDLVPLSAVVYGSIFPAGTRVNMEFASHAGLCGSTAPAADSRQHGTLLNVGAAYRHPLTPAATAGVRCLTVVAVAGAVVRQDSVSLEFNSPTRIDSARVDLRF